VDPVPDPLLLRGIEPGNSGPIATNSDHQTTEAVCISSGLDLVHFTDVRTKFRATLYIYIYLAYKGGAVSVTVRIPVGSTFNSLSLLYNMDVGHFLEG
jgi:hypothetical protein